MRKILAALQKKRKGKRQQLSLISIIYARKPEILYFKFYSSLHKWDNKIDDKMVFANQTTLLGMQKIEEQYDTKNLLDFDLRLVIESINMLGCSIFWN